MATKAQNHSPTPRPIALRAGAYAPMLTMFQSNEDIDLATQKKHAVRLAKDGLVGLVAMGSNGEAVHLTREERSAITKSVRSALDEAGFSHVPVIAGCSDQSVRGTVTLCKDACDAGASYALVLPPSYYKPAMTPAVLQKFFTDVADASPIPIMMYNYPGAVAGIDMDSDLMIVIAKHPNVQGAKFTCANTGKLTRLAAATNAISVKNTNSGFLACGGFADMVVQCMVSSGSGVIAGTGNVFPKLCAKVWELCEKGELDKAVEMQKVLAEADWELSKTGISGTKAALRGFCGYGEMVRRPLQGVNEEGTRQIMRGLSRAMELEKSF